MKQIKTVLFTGDSITDCNRARPIGEGFGKIGDSYVARLFVEAWADHPDNHVRFLNSAVSGDTSAQLLARFDTDVIAYKPDYVFIMIGVNDAGRHFDGAQLTDKLISPSGSAANMEKMLQKTIAAGATPIMISPYFLDQNHKDPMRKLLDEINAKYKALAETYKIAYLDIQSCFDAYIKVAGTSCLLSHDRVHPNAVGIAVIAKYITASEAYRAIFND